MRALGTEHDSITCRSADLWPLFESAVWHAEHHWCAPPAAHVAALRRVHDAGYRVVLTGERADEFFAGYDLFKELKIRRFWSRTPDSRARPRLFERLYPYLARSPAKAAAFARGFFGNGLADPDAPLFSHLTRMAATARAKTLLSSEVGAELGAAAHDELLESLPPEFAEWDPLNRAQYLEATLLLPGYLCSSQASACSWQLGEGRYPFSPGSDRAFDADRAAPLMAGFARNSCSSARVEDLVPPLRRRTKQPYRAPHLNPLQTSAGTRAFARAALPRAAAGVRLLRLRQGELAAAQEARNCFERSRQHGAQRSARTHTYSRFIAASERPARAAPTCRMHPSSGDRVSQLELDITY